jgi:hypothetical protein
MPKLVYNLLKVWIQITINPCLILPYTSYSCKLVPVLDLYVVDLSSRVVRIRQFDGRNLILREFS